MVLVPKESDNSIRLFYAVRPHPEHILAINKFSSCNEGLEGVRWVPEEHLHITLYFIGNVDKELLPAFADATSALMRTQQTLALSPLGIEFIFRKNGGSMLWLRYSKVAAFASIHNKFQSLVKTITGGVIVSHSPIPHVTIARLGRKFKIDSFNYLGRHELQPLIINGCELWQSVRIDDKVVYQPLSKWQFEGS